VAVLCEEGDFSAVATASAVRTWPFRVCSFPSELRLLSIAELKRIYVERAMTSLLAEARENMWIPSWSVPTLQTPFMRPSQREW